ncbi:hypothetical protein [Polaribacter sp. Hel1_85]|uniref:hypothetical protein n=1 Tax=Polaribacter sp. Hel1_85 TaxID=1250005 RepID=UPI00052B8F78|nr:hypothetical protein [Polaribacter sp. Hel1_85]KGL62795.1 hypothetical protein PHEL85_2590 [Polaribacter sp. Hel1_85]
MKIKKQLLVLTLIGVLFSSCNTEEPKLNLDLNLNTLEGKWLINNSTEYDFIEFTNEGIFFINKKEVTNDPDFSNFSIYEIVNDNIIGIANLGAIFVNNLTEFKMDFVLELSDNTQINLTANKTSFISESERTALISKIWGIESINGLENDLGILLFSKSGTFYEIRSNIKFGEWNWCNNEETKVSITTNSSSLDCTNNQVIENITLTDNSFTGIDKRNGTPETIILKTD